MKILMRNEENGTPDENEEKDNFYRNESSENPRVNEEKAKLDIRRKRRRILILNSVGMHAANGDLLQKNVLFLH